MARKPRSSLHAATKKQLIDKLNQQVSEQYSDYGDARAALGRRLSGDIDKLYEAAWYVINAEVLSDRQARYLMVKSLLDKIAPDRREHTRADVGPRTAPVLIQVNGVNRGTVAAREEAIERGRAVTIDVPSEPNG